VPSLHLARVGERFKNYRSTLDKKRREVFDYLLYELAGRREETLVMHPDHTEAAIMNILVELEMRYRQTEDRIRRLEEGRK
jgi:BarA-like signal transduction histidine kinase